jgi:hypothetical protein
METWQDALIVALGEAAGGSGVLNETAGRITPRLLSPVCSLDEIAAIGASKAMAASRCGVADWHGCARFRWRRRDYYGL